MDHHKLDANGPIVSIRGVARLRRTESIFSTENHCRAKNTVMAECRARLPRSYRQWKESEGTLSVALALIDIGENVFDGLEPLAGLLDRLDSGIGILSCMSNAQQCFVGLRKDIPVGSIRQ